MAPSFVIDGGREFPMVRIPDFKFQDWALIREITGLSSAEFLLAHDHESGPDELVMFGYAAVAFWHGNPSLSRARVAAYAGEWATGDVVLQDDEPEVDDAANPPAGDGGSTSSEAPSPTSDDANPGQDEPSDGTTPTSSGGPG